MTNPITMTNPMNKPAPAPPPPGYRSPPPPNPRNYVWVGAAILAGLAGGFTAVFLVIIGPAIDAIDEPPDPHLSGRTVGLVERAISHYERNGLASTVDHYTAEFQRQRGGRYLILLDDDGSVLLNPYDAPGVAGASLADAVTDDGRPLLEALAETADAGGGWVSTHFANRRHDLVERKHLYVLPHDGIVFVSGYHDSATGSISWSPPRTSSAPS